MKKVMFLLIGLLQAIVCFAQVIIPGDVNGNGKVNIDDALLIARYSAGMQLPVFIKEAADTDCSGTVTITDALNVARLSAGLIMQLPCVITPTLSPAPTTTPGPSSNVPAVGTPIGWAACNALGQNGTKGGAGGSIINVYNKAALDLALNKDNNPAIILVHGTLTGGPAMDSNVKSNKTIIGVDNGAYLDFGLYLRGNNIIIKNLDIMNGGFEPGDSEGLDGVTFAQDLHHIWVDHCTIHETRDGLVDPTRNARFVTISYCYFHTQKTAVLIGASDSDDAARAAQSASDKSAWHYTVTVHHNYWKGVYERCPRVRFGAVHVFNNFYDNNSNYAIGRGDRCNIYSEANYFLNTHNAFGSYDDNANPGFIDDVNSYFEGNNGNATDNPPSGSWVWNPVQYYSYTVHSASWVKENLKNYAGAGKENP